MHSFLFLKNLKLLANTSILNKNYHNKNYHKMYNSVFLIFWLNLNLYYLIYSLENFRNPNYLIYHYILFLVSHFLKKHEHLRFLNLQGNVYFPIYHYLQTHIYLLLLIKITLKYPTFELFQMQTRPHLLYLYHPITSNLLFC